MGCDTCRKKRDINLSKLEYNRKKQVALPASPEGYYIFQGKFSKFLYFMLLVVIAITPIVNIIMVVFFWKAVYGKNLSKKTRKNVEIDKDKDKTE